MIALILPAAVSSAAVCRDAADDRLFPQERALLGRALPNRVREFAAGRACARRALGALGFPETAILRGPNREPQWPEGIVGSITHCTGYRAAAVARDREFLTLGIDAEPHHKLPAGIAERVLDDTERAWLATAPGGIHWDRVIFSAKESVYKAWFPLARAWLGFDDATVSVAPATATFRAQLKVSPPAALGAALCGRFLVQDGLVLTAIAIPR